MPAIRRTTFALLLFCTGCNGGLEPVPATACPPGFVGICGTIRIRGALPESTDVVYLVAYPDFPQGRADLFTFEPTPTPPTLPTGDSVVTYNLPVPPGHYEWILAVWKKVGTLTPANAESLLYETGFYRDPADRGRPGGATVPPGGARDSIDFLVDFDQRHPVSFWYPAAR